MPLIEDSTSLMMPSLTKASSSEHLEDLPNPSKKRKRVTDAAEEIEVDVNAPEPPSKKALRKAKKHKLPGGATSASNLTEGEEVADTAPRKEESSTEKTISSKRSEHGIWIGNLSFNISKADLQTFLTKDTTITESVITRIHMPPPSNTSEQRQKIKPHNKGFAYVDFSNQEAVTEAVTLSETLLSGRKVLIKDSHDFEGRPEKSDDLNQNGARASAVGTKRPPSKKIFVGNLPFQTEKAHLEEHFSPCGNIVDVHVASFEDSGKCKGYAWVTFDDTAAAEAALRGWVISQSEDTDTDEDEEEQGNGEDMDTSKKAKNKKRKPQKPRKRWVNNFWGRLLRMEFAEEATVRYKKRFGKNAPKTSQENGVANPQPSDEGVVTETADSKLNARTMPAQGPPRAQKKVDARTIKPGAALAAAPRLTGGIVASQGKKITFE